MLFFAHLWQPVTDVWSRMTALPVLGAAMRFLHNPKHYDVTFIPINEELNTSESTVVPKQIVEEMITRASHIIRLPTCLCRLGCRCDHFPLDIGCLFLGESTRDADPSLGIPVSKVQALEHMQRAIDAGLILQIGKVDADPFFLQIKSHKWDRFMTLCFCCPCCCVAMRNAKRFSPKITALMHKLEGLKIEVTDECNGCSSCVKSCFTGAISMHEKKARIDHSACKGCGICAERCPRDAITIEVVDPNMMTQAAITRLEKCAHISA